MILGWVDNNYYKVMSKQRNMQGGQEFILRSWAEFLSGLDKLPKI
jgi:hypothetical protein